MSNKYHRQPVWTWSVVLISTLLLSPVASSAIHQALLLHGAGVVPVSPISPESRRPTSEPQSVPGGATELRAISSEARRSEEGDALLRAMRAGRAFVVRFDNASDDSSATLLLLYATPVGVTPRFASDSQVFALESTHPRTSRPLRRVPPRAPPILI